MKNGQQQLKTRREGTPFLITLWGVFDRFSLVGGAYQHKRQIKEENGRTDPEETGWEKTGWVFWFPLKK